MTTLTPGTNKPVADRYDFDGGGTFVYLHFGQETPKEEEDRQALLQRVADSLGLHFVRRTAD